MTAHNNALGRLGRGAERAVPCTCMWIKLDHRHERGMSTLESIFRALQNIRITVVS